MNKQEKFNFYFLLLLQFLAISFMEMSGPFWPSFLKELNNDSDDTLQIYSFFVYGIPIVFSILSSPFWGKLSNIFGHKNMVIRSFLGISITQYLIATTNSIEMIILYRALQGIFAGVIASTMAYSSQFFGKEKNAYISYLQSSTAAGISIGPIVGGIVSEYFSIKMIFYISSIGSFIISILAIFILLPTKVKKQKSLKDNNFLSHDVKKNVMLFFYIIFLFQCSKMIPTTFFVLYCEDFLNIKPFLIGVIYSLSGIMTFIFSPIWGKLFNRLELKNSYKLLSILTFLTSISSYIYTVSNDLIIIILNRILWGITISAFLPFFYSRLLSVISKESSAYWIGYSNSITKIGNLFGIFIGSISIILFSNLLSGFLVMSLVYLLITILIIRKFIIKEKYVIN